MPRGHHWLRGAEPFLLLLRGDLPLILARKHERLRSHGQLEGEEVVAWLNKLGVTGIILNLLDLDRGVCQLAAVSGIPQAGY